MFALPLAFIFVTLTVVVHAAVDLIVFSVSAVLAGSAPLVRKRDPSRFPRAVAVRTCRSD